VQVQGHDATVVVELGGTHRFGATNTDEDAGDTGGT
jgi:hypothetical protein